MRKRDHGGNSFFSGLVLGALAAVGAHYFLTKTDEGKKFKSQLKQKGQEALDGLAETVEDFEEKGEELKKKAKKLQSELEKKAKDIKEEVTQEAKKPLTSRRFFKKNGKDLAK